MAHFTHSDLLHQLVLPAFAMGSLLGATACQSRAPVATNSPANAGFEALRQQQGPAALAAPAEPATLDADTQQRIAESISLLDAYFADSTTENQTDDSATKAGYDPSAERGPTGTRHLALVPAESALLTRGLVIDEKKPTIQIDPVIGVRSAEDRLLGLNRFEPTSENATSQGLSDSEPISSTRVISIASPIFEPSFRWPPTPGGVGIVKAAETSSGFEDNGLGVAVASADGSLPAIPGVVGGAGGEGDLTLGPTRAETGERSDLDPEDRKNEIVEELVGILTQLGEIEDDPYRAGLALAGLETLSPGALYDLVDSGTLLPNETEILLAAHEFFQGLASDPKQANPESAMDLVDEVRERLNQSAPLRITAAELCTRVWGYGQYETFEKNADGSYRFMVGHRQPIIIYTEVDRFGRKPTIDTYGVAQWEVELSQELQIFHLADDLLVTARTAETDTSLSRSKMRDYYLINQTYLPETLSLGKYHLKIIMRDANKGAIAETVIPFQIVASSTLDGG